MTNEEMGAVIKSTRKKAGMSIRELSAATGINISNLSRIENGKLAVTIEMADRILTPLNHQIAVIEIGVH